MLCNTVRRCQPNGLEQAVHAEQFARRLDWTAGAFYVVALFRSCFEQADYMTGW